MPHAVPDGHHNLSYDALIYEVLFLSPIFSLSLMMGLFWNHAEAKAFGSITRGHAESAGRRSRIHHIDNNHFSFIALIWRVNRDVSIAFWSLIYSVINKIAANQWRTQSSSFQIIIATACFMAIFMCSLLLHCAIYVLAVWRRCVSWMEPLSGKISARRTWMKRRTLFIYSPAKINTRSFFTVCTWHTRAFHRLD